MKSSVDIRFKIDDQKRIAIRQNVLSNQALFPPDAINHKIQALIATTFIAALQWVLEETNETPNTSNVAHTDSPEWQPGANNH